MAQRLAAVDAVAVTAALLRDGDEAGVLHVAHDFLNRSLGDPHVSRNVPQSGLPIACQADQYVSVIAEKCPFAHDEFLERHPPCASVRKL